MDLSRFETRYLVFATVWKKKRGWGVRKKQTGFVVVVSKVVTTSGFFVVENQPGL